MGDEPPYASHSSSGSDSDHAAAGVGVGVATAGPGTRPWQLVLRNPLLQFLEPGNHVSKEIGPIAFQVPWDHLMSPSVLSEKFPL
jgi:hypothetical protein